MDNHSLFYSKRINCYSQPYISPLDCDGQVERRYSYLLGGFSGFFVGFFDHLFGDTDIQVKNSDMIQKSDAILLRKQDLRETSLFLTFYTRGFGKIYGVIKGIRGQKGLYGASPQLFSLNEIVFYEKKVKEVFIISHCELKEFYGEIRESLEKTVYAMYFIELINSLTPTAEPSAEMFELLEKALMFLKGQASSKRIARVFEIKLLGLLGLMPHLGSCVVCGSSSPKKARFSFKHSGVICDACSAKERDGFPVAAGTINFVEHINRSDWQMISRIKVSQDVGRQVERLLISFMHYHLHLKPKSLEFMRKVLV